MFNSVPSKAVADISKTILWEISRFYHLLSVTWSHWQEYAVYQAQFHKSNIGFIHRQRKHNEIINFLVLTTNIKNTYINTSIRIKEKIICHKILVNNLCCNLCEAVYKFRNSCWCKLFDSYPKVLMYTSCTCLDLYKLFKQHNGTCLLPRIRCNTDICREHWTFYFANARYSSVFGEWFSAKSMALANETLDVPLF